MMDMENDGKEEALALVGKAIKMLEQAGLSAKGLIEDYCDVHCENAPEMDEGSEDDVKDEASDMAEGPDDKAKRKSLSIAIMMKKKPGMAE